MTARVLSGWWLTGCLVLCSAQPVTGQSVDSSAVIRSKQLAAAGWVPARESRVAPLRRVVALDLSEASIKSALQAIRQKANLDIVFGDDVLASKAQVSLHVENMTVLEALTQVLDGTGLEAFVSLRGDVVLVRSMPPVPAQTGTIAGAVTDAKTGAALAGATIVVEGTSKSSTTGSDGRYRIADVAPGTYTMRARYIGYSPGSASVTVNADQEATADLALEKSAQRLNEVVTTGTVVPTEVKALPMPVSVINDSDITLQRPHSVQELVRQAVPTAVSWDYPNTPYQTSFSVRGASTLLPGIGQMKVFVDGLEVANPTDAAIDPTSIERVEVIRGPQAAAIYGSDAIGGVIQIFTKRGDPTLARPQLDAEAVLGLVQTPYAGNNGVFRQAYRGSVLGGGPNLSYNFGGGYSRTNDWLPNGQQSAQSNPSVYGGMRFARGIVTADVSGRYFVQNSPQVFNPAFGETGDVYYSKPFYQPVQSQNQTVGVRFNLAPARGWQHTVTLGLDRYTQDEAQTQPRLTTPADTLLTALYAAQTKTSIGYNTSIAGFLGANLSGSLIAGFDHYSLPNTLWFTSGALNTTGAIQPAPGNSFFVSRTITNNTGYFAQAQIGFHDALFLTGGFRAEQNTNFGDSLGTPISPRVGLSYVQQVSGVTFKSRGSWGRAIRAPNPGQKVANSLAGFVQLASPALGPERQHGWDAGVDLFFREHGSLSVTYYNQTADALIQFVQLLTTSVPTYQYQNVGRVKNTGVEVEGVANLGLLQLRGQYGYARSRVEQLGPNYTGDLRVGDRTLISPTHTAGGSLTIYPVRGTTVAAGITYVGGWTAYDILALSRCFGGTGPCHSSFRDYHADYPGFVKLNATISQQLTRQVVGFISVDNLTNNQAYEVQNSVPVIGRITTTGLRVHY